MSANDHHRATLPELKRYLPRLWGYLCAERRLVSASLLFGAAGLSIPFIFPHLIGMLFDEVIVGRSHNFGAILAYAQRIEILKRLTVLSILTAAAFTLIGYAKGHFTLSLGNRIIGRLRQDLFKHYQQLPLSHFGEERSGSLAWQLLQEVNGVANLIYAGALLALFDVIQILAALVCLIAISPSLTAGIVVLLPVYAAVVLLLNPGVRRASDAVNRQWEIMSANLHEQFSAITLTKAYGAEARERARFNSDGEQQLQNILRQSRLGHAMGAISEGVIHLGTATIIGYGGWLALHNDRFSIGMLTEYLGYVGILYGPIRRCAELNLVYQNSWASLKRVMEIFDIAPAVIEHPRPILRPPGRGQVIFDHVNFSYAGLHDTSQRVHAFSINDVQLSIGTGERVALVGGSGAGKSTLAALLLRFFDVESGSILIDGKDLREYSNEALRDAIAVVPQDSFLFSGTIRDNMLYGNPHASPNELRAAAVAANAHQFVSEFPDGYSTVVGERGLFLSGGQRQRICIARALLKNPRILILDEATSALDAESDRLVQQALDRLMMGRSSLIIAHRLSTIRHVDRIYAMQGGSIMESGSHDELMKSGGYYSRLVHAQGHYQSARSANACTP
jgi:ABC-type multidrug transport system fused ATPase/permease subunit